jgi:Trypsin-like peptidase domain
MRPEEGIARILDADGRPVGLAFAVAGGQVVTCAHVVNAALGRRPRDDRSPGLVAITLAFLFGRAVGADARSQATLVHWQPTHGAFDLNDLALLRLTGDLPVGVTPLAIGGADPAGPVQMLGPVADRRTHGHVTGTLLGAVQPGRFQVNQAVAGAFRVGHGFSGGPVWRPSTGEVVAVLQASAVDDGATDVYALDIALVADALATPADSRPSWSARATTGL